MKLCSVPGCKNTVKARGLCEPHYKRSRSAKGLQPDKPIAKPLAIRRLEKKHKLGACSGAADRVRITYKSHPARMIDMKTGERVYPTKE